jgi:hypothetical protein
MQLDGELSELEQARLDEHLESCASCRALASDLAGVTNALRTIPLEEPSFHYYVPRRRTAGARVARAMSSTAAIALVALSGLAGLSALVDHGFFSSSRSTVLDLRAARERITVKEHLLDQLSSNARPLSQQVRPDLARAERVSLPVASSAAVQQFTVSGLEARARR